MTTPKDPPTFTERFFDKERTQEDYALMDARLQDRHLPAGRGRIYLGLRVTSGPIWAADYRAIDGTLFGAHAVEIAEAHNWIRLKAKEATK